MMTPWSMFSSSAASVRALTLARPVAARRGARCRAARVPGIGPVATISVLLPLTIGLDATAAVIMIAGIYYGAAYGGSTTSILMNLPGEASTVVTCIDGHQMARQGRAGTALSVAAFGSF